MSRLVFNFPDNVSRSDFVQWLCGAGEQDYWMWMEHQEGSEVSFDYHKDDAYSKEKDEVTIFTKF